MTVEEQVSRLCFPYWCGRNPEAWRKAADSGLLGLLNGSTDKQQFPDVGLFNLVWVLEDEEVDGTTCNSSQAKMKVIFVLQHVKVLFRGKAVPLNELAALTTLSQFLAALPYAAVLEGLHNACLSKLSKQTHV